MRIRGRSWGRAAAVFVGATLVVLVAVVPSASGGARHARWDIISFSGTPPGPLNPGGFAEAKTPEGAKIKLTGSGTFVAPPGGNGGSGAVTGGGTWQTFDAGGVSTASGTYTVTRLVTFEFANFASATPVFIDNIGALDERANGTAVLTIQYSDGSRGVLTVGCHGPGAPPGIFEGIAVTKGFTTYYDVQAPVGGVDANRTLFHVSS
ncbi:MAG: hypothetical protein ACRDH0_04495 [Actinomycetota bacterium]